VEVAAKTDLSKLERILNSIKESLAIAGKKEGERRYILRCRGRQGEGSLSHLYGALVRFMAWPVTE